MKLFLGLSFAVGLIFPVGFALAQQDSCYPDLPLETIIVDASNGTSGVTPPVRLPPSPGSPDKTLFQVEVLWQRQLDDNFSFLPRFSFPDPDNVGLPFNVFKLVWTVFYPDGSKQRKVHDLTDDCRQPGFSLFRNQTAVLSAAELRLTRRPASVELAVWGNY